MLTQSILSGALFILFLLMVVLISYFMTGFVRKYSITHAVIDVPNARSSHDVPTPTGGGIAIVLALSASMIIFYFTGYFSLPLLLAIGVGGVLIAIIGWIDDHGHIHAGWRIILYLLIVLWALYWSFAPEQLHQNENLTVLKYFCLLLLILGLVWLINLYNFMDGTDGLAASQAVCASLLAGLLLILSGAEALAAVCFTLAAAGMGFLIWNWPGAKIFMGDVGSCYIGFVLGIIAIISELSGLLSIVIWIILLSVFFVDATLTLGMRFITGRKWYSAHKEHAYQRFVQLGNSHLTLLLYVIAINLLFLWPMAMLAFYYREFAVSLMIFVFLVMVILWSVIQIKFSKYETAKD